MDLWRLDIFCHVVDTRSFSEAGRRVHISQPTVSSHIRELEAHFQCRLIDRLAKAAVPTRAGELLYTYARRLLTLRDETESALAQFQGQIKGRVLVGGSTIPGAYVWPRLIGGFTMRHPQVQVQLTIGDTRAVTDRVRDGRVDFGIVGAPSDHRDVDQTLLMADPLRVVVPGPHPWAGRDRISFDELCEEPFIMRETGSGTRQTMGEMLAAADMPMERLRVVAEMGSTEAVIQGILGGVGISIISEIAVSSQLAGGALAAVRIDGLDMIRRFYLTRHRHRTLSPVADALFRFVKEAAAEAPAE